jgi:hypothetical protein
MNTMSTDDVDTNDLLKHDAMYDVLVCLKYRYAIPRSALDQHTLRHKTYRGGRGRLL